jgi:hypothetical protein
LHFVGGRHSAAARPNTRSALARKVGTVLVSGLVWSGAAAVPAMAADGGDDRVIGTTFVSVLILTILAFVGAIVAARRTLRSPMDADAVASPDLIKMDLLATQPRSSSEPRVVRVFEGVFLVVLLLYAALDRGFAWFHVPGTPLFIGEITLVIGVLALFATRVPLYAAIRRSAGLKALAAWMAWGFVFLFAQIPEFGLDAIRDSALWYYGAAALFTVFLLLSDTSRFGRWADAFGKVLPFLLGWFPIAMILATVFGEGAPFVPDSTVPLFVHRFGNIAILSAVAIGFIWLVERERGRFSSNQRIAYTVLASIGLLLASFQNRGGMVAAVMGIVLMLFFLQRSRADLMLVLAGVVVLGATVAVVTDVRVPTTGGREISAAQMIDNITSVVNPSSGGNRQTETTQWRLDLWTAVVDDVTNERPLTGFGPGPNLGAKYGVTTNEDIPLRNPHNSHIGILARMGWIGVGMWAILWVVWAFVLLMLRSQLLRHGRSAEAGLAAWLLVSEAMMLVNAIFDPTLEGPQVSFWIWFFFGIGAAMPLVYSGMGALGRAQLPASISSDGLVATAVGLDEPTLP